MTLKDKILKHLAVASFTLGLYNTFSKRSEINSLRENLHLEQQKNVKLISEIDNLAYKKISEQKLEEIINKNNEFTNNRLTELSNKVDKAINDNTDVSEITKTISEINRELEKIIDKIDDSLKSSIIDSNIIEIIHSKITNLNYFQSIALTHISAIVFITFSLISLIAIYFGDYLIEKYFNKEKYPRIYKFIELRRKFQRYYLILDLTIIFIMLFILTILNIMLFIDFTN